MKKFRDFITEEVVPSALVQNGSIELDKEEVRASINMALAKVTADGAVTPYIALNRIQKALAYFHIILPKRVYMEGAKGVEVHELRQFGHKMGMTDQGEFVSEVPGKYYLFMQYNMNTPMVHGGQKAWPTMAGTFRVMAKVVDQIELDRLISMAELALAEDCMDAEAQQKRAKVLAPHETMRDVTSDEKKKGNKAAVADSEKGLNEVSLGKLVRYKRGAEKSHGDATWETKFTKYMGDDASPSKALARKREKGIALADKKMKGKAKVNASMPKNAYMEEDKKVKVKLNPEKKIGYTVHDVGPGGKKTLVKSGETKVKDIKEEQIDEVSVGLAHRAAHHAFVKSDRMKKDAQKEPDMHSYVQSVHKAEKKSKQGTRFAKYAAKKMEEAQIDEKLTKRMSAGDVISDFVHSEDPKFRGKTKKERMKMALGAYYGMHPEKSKK